MTDIPLTDTADESASQATYSPFTAVEETPPDKLDLWPSYVIPKEAIDAEIARLAGLPRPSDGRRRSLIRHPSATGAGPGLAAGLGAGIRVTIGVLLPGERTAPIRHNSTQVVFAIHGSGEVVIDGRTRHF